jgi:hypothetical protein
MSTDWYQIRNLFLGLNYKSRNFRAALSLAKKSTHPNAVWLCELYPDKTPKSVWEIVSVLERDHSALSTTFVGILYDNYECIYEGARGGCILAQSLLLRIDDQWEESVLANHGNDPIILYHLAQHLQLFTLLRRSAELGHIDAMIEYAKVGYSQFDPRKLEWYTSEVLSVRNGRKAINQMIARFPDIPNQFLYHFGKLLNCRYGTVTFIAQHYKVAVAGCSGAVATWLMSAKKLGIVKDVRCLIGRMLWKSAWRWIAKEEYLEQRKMQQFFQIVQ